MIYTNLIVTANNLVGYYIGHLILLCYNVRIYPILYTSSLQLLMFENLSK
jgi:hypothetical protein